MNADVKEKLHEIYNEIMEKPLKIKEIFDDYYGEERVDLQGYLKLEDLIENFEDRDNIEFTQELIDEIHYMYNNLFILVYFPKVRVTNEYNKYIDITQLWARVYIKYEGKSIGYFDLNRSEYTENQFRSNYLHSHVSSIPVSDFSMFQAPCLGDGPIRSTLATLAVDFDEAIWKLFCLELDKYVQVESLTGVPYIKLENVQDYSTYSTINSFATQNLNGPVPYRGFWSRELIKSFLSYIFYHRILKFNYYNNQYGIALSFYEYMIIISNAFIRWYNSLYKIEECKIIYRELLDDKILFGAIVKDNKIYVKTSIRQYNPLNNYNGKYVCTFKGKDILLNIIPNELLEDYNTTLLNLDFAGYVYISILKMLNCNYGRNNSTEESSGEEETIATGSAKRYI